jgi:hypothetical protein
MGYFFGIEPKPVLWGWGILQKYSPAIILRGGVRLPELNRKLLPEEGLVYRNQGRRLFPEMGLIAAMGGGGDSE